VEDSELRETIKLLAQCIDELGVAVQDLQQRAGIAGSTWHNSEWVRVETLRRTAASIAENINNGRP
jgi:hypothetical protein